LLLLKEVFEMKVMAFILAGGEAAG